MKFRMGIICFFDPQDEGQRNKGINGLSGVLRKRRHQSGHSLFQDGSGAGDIHPFKAGAVGTEPVTVIQGQTRLFFDGFHDLFRGHPQGIEVYPGQVCPLQIQYTGSGSPASTVSLR